MSGLLALVVAAALAGPPPPSMDSFAIDSHGSRLNALIYQAAGAGPHPVALFLHGFPGNEKNLDLAQAVRRAGWDAIYFNYRGSWGSAGTFSMANSLEDVAAALAWIRTPANAQKHHFDASRVAIVGHSFGGWLALESARQQPASVCVAVMAAWNVGWQVEHRAEKPALWAGVTEMVADATAPDGGPLRAGTDAVLKEIAGAPPAWNYLSQADALRDRPLFLIAASGDGPGLDPAMHASLAKAVGGTRVRTLTYEDDHAFSASRLPLAEALTQWLNGDCSPSRNQP